MSFGTAVSFGTAGPVGVRPGGLVRAHAGSTTGAGTDTLGANRRRGGRPMRDRHGSQVAVGKWKLEPVGPSTCGHREVTTFDRV